MSLLRLVVSWVGWGYYSILLPDVTVQHLYLVAFRRFCFKIAIASRRIWVQMICPKERLAYYSARLGQAAQECTSKRIITSKLWNVQETSNRPAQQFPLSPLFRSKSPSLLTSTVSTFPAPSRVPPRCHSFTLRKITILLNRKELKLANINEWWNVLGRKISSGVLLVPFRLGPTNVFWPDEEVIIFPSWKKAEKIVWRRGVLYRLSASFT